MATLSSKCTAFAMPDATSEEHTPTGPAASTDVDTPRPEAVPARRRFLRRVALAGASVLLAGCGGGNSSSEEAANRTDTDSTASATEANRCAEPSQLSEAAQSGREKYDYVARSPHPQKQCGNCQFWVAAEAGQPCGGCQLFPGPVHLEGYCTAWLRA